MKTIIAVIVLVVAAVAVNLACADERPIVDRAYVQEAARRNALIWDVRAADEYRKGHIPGAVNIGDIARVLRDENTEDFIPTARIEKLLGDAGIDPTRDLVLYGSRGTWNPYFGLYTAQYFSGRRARVYHDGIEDWTAAGLPVARDDVKLGPIALMLRVDPMVSISTRDVVAKLHGSDVQILDVRTPPEFSGEDIRAIRGGHVPGAVNIPYEQNWVDPASLQKLARREVADSTGMSLKPLDQLKRLYAKLDPDKETIVYCQSGARASETAGVLQQLGFTKVKVYDSSWLGYGNTLDAPADDVTFFNVGLLNAKLSALQNRIEQLERELADAKAAKK